jgi:signal transduction histidine kinase
VLTHGGSIACTSRPNDGSDFYFLLPKDAAQTRRVAVDNVH